MHYALLAPCPPAISDCPCPPTVAGPYAAWMPCKSLHGRTCGVSCDGGRARACSQAPDQPLWRPPCPEAAHAHIAHAASNSSSAA
ncbi:hypothetical protein XacyCFBP1159_17430 [Xanthomonas arboricola pv. corylina]|nr:hypothetical protein XacyCFBP2565_02450 [Xanthomonas arboricola pv. corylina]PPU58032.1 hypothetical protein XacyCFBP1159_17430 [Xanthomonas arboricola pv. corylina]